MATDTVDFLERQAEDAARDHRDGDADTLNAHAAYVRSLENQVRDLQAENSQAHEYLRISTARMQQTAQQLDQARDLLKVA